MDDSEKKMLNEFIMSRLTKAYDRLKYSDRYNEVCERQRKSEAEVDELFHGLDKNERITVRRHYEGEVEKSGCELSEMYIQGLKDGVRILALLGVFNNGQAF